ncbi:Nucleoside-diphosphate-sugar epimerases [hydrothermal vent metagenome]|uniref:Nucleoside-diphosphate-sugar epimerases n=1 Tax=hydrothermal vent metagenome TaxID=652676 RepID=A0A3B0SBD1_9ZZZZ
MHHILIFGLGYTATRLANELRAKGWQVTGTRRNATDNAIAFDDRAAVEKAMEKASHILSSVPPDKSGSDPVLKYYGKQIARSSAEWIGYLSSTGVYGDVAGAWVDESAPIGSGRRKARSNADQRWQKLCANVHVFRLPAIYGPGRSAFDRIREGTARPIDMPDQLFSRVHVDDIISAVIASFDGSPGVYNVADDYPAPQHEVIVHAAQLLGIEIPPLLPLDEANLSKAAMGFYSESRRIANGKTKRLLDWEPKYASYRMGLIAIQKQDRRLAE